MIVLYICCLKIDWSDLFLRAGMLPPKEFSNFAVFYWIPSIFLEVKCTPFIHFETTHPTTRWYSRVGGFKYFFMFTPNLGEMIEFDDCAYFFRWVGEKPPTRLPREAQLPRVFFFQKAQKFFTSFSKAGVQRRTGAPFEGETKTKVIGFLLGGSCQLVSG